MAEIKTCEEYVLAELSRKEAELDAEREKRYGEMVQKQWLMGVVDLLRQAIEYRPAADGSGKGELVMKREVVIDPSADANQARIHEAFMKTLGAGWPEPEEEPEAVQEVAEVEAAEDAEDPEAVVVGGMA